MTDKPSTNSERILYQTEGGYARTQCRLEGERSIRQLEHTAVEDSVIQTFRITAGETKSLGEGDQKARSGQEG
jgi:hypothetical protein